MNDATGTDLRELNDCGCCAGRGDQTPAEVINRPGLTAIAYRAGTYTQFFDSMLAQLSSAKLPAIAGLCTRDSDDFSIALLDAWATVADVLTFYQERIANESYLRTATERRSLLEMARLIGYEPRPGVAASALLAFTLEEALGSPRRTTINRGGKVQSIPGPDEKPQMFETLESVEARVEWNAMRPQTSHFTLPTFSDTSLYLKGTATNLKAGDMLMLVGDEKELHPEDDRWDLRRLQSVQPDFEVGRTRVTWKEGLGSRRPSKKPAANPRVFALRQRASLFGHNAPPWTTLPLALREGERSPNPADKRKFIPGEYAGRKSAWSDANLPKNTGQIHLDTVYSQVPAGSWVVLSTVFPSDYAELYQVQAVAEETISRFNLTAKCTRLEISGENTNKFSPLRTSVYVQSEELELAETPIMEYIGLDKIELDRVVLDLPPQQTLVVRGKLPRVLVADKSKGLPLVADGTPVGTVKRGELLTVLTSPVPQRGQKNVMRWHLRDRRGVAGYVDDPNEQILPVAPIDEDAFVSEIVTLDRTDLSDPDHTVLKLRQPLVNVYDRTTVTINANVAHSSHGESVAEVMGSGDASRPFQRFVLRQPPLTYVSASTPSGAGSTLRIFVNDLEWHETPTLYGCGARDRVFTTRTDDDGRTVVQFGDGVTGARLPTGQENVRATYRKGIGLGGLVQANQLSMLMTRPLGVKSVTNPANATGAADRESLDDARLNAPLTVLTLDRIVSLRDYEDFTRAYAGIAKALATWTGCGRTREVFLTVAGPRGAAIVPLQQPYENLLAALKRAGDPNVRFCVKSFRDVPFRIVGSFRVAADYQPELVKAAVDAALLAHFSFEARSFGQSVTLSEVVAVVQNVPGVLMVDVDGIVRNGGELSSGRLLAAMPEGELAAELLTLSSTHLDTLQVTL